MGAWMNNAVKPANRSLENVLTPVSLSGTVVPRSRGLNASANDYTVVGPSGLEYFIVGDEKWKEVLNRCAWEKVKVIGLLNAVNMSVIPQKIIPIGASGDRESLVDFALWKGRFLARKLMTGVNELVLVPAAIWSVLA